MPQRHFEVDTAEYPFVSHWYERNGTHMHYVDEGEGFPIVMCHGNPTWSFLYRKIIKQMKGKARCIALDYPGFGYSEHPPAYDYKPASHAEWVESLLIDHLDLEKFIIVCQDWGGPIGLTVATRHSDRVAGAVISSTWAWQSDKLLFRVFSGVLGTEFMHDQIRSRNLFARRIMPAIMSKEFRKPEILKAYTDPFPTPDSREGTAVFPREIMASGDWLNELEGNLYKLKGKPVEFVWGLKDMISGRDTQERWLSHFPDAGVQKIKNANHFTQEECPENYVIALERILNNVGQ